MLERKERLNEVYEHLHNQCGCALDGDMVNKKEAAA